MIPNNLFPILIAALVVAGCSSTSNDSANSTSASVQPASAQQFVQLNGEQIRSQIIGNTLTGRNSNFTQVGTIDYLVHYSPDGTSKDRLKFLRGGKIDRASGIWRIANEDEGIICSTATKRNQGKERCARMFVQNDQFRSEPLEPGRKGVTGRIIPGDQVQ